MSLLSFILAASVTRPRPASHKDGGVKARMERSLKVVSSQGQGLERTTLEMPFTTHPMVMQKQKATSNKCIASSNKCLTSSNKKLVETISY